MSRNYELDLLKSQEQVAFQRKQAAFQRYQQQKDYTHSLYLDLQAAWQARSEARDEMNREYELKQEQKERNDAVWSEYSRIRDNNNARIESLRYDADNEHRSMIECYEQASSAYQYGDKSMAPVFSQEAREHKVRRDELNAEVSQLIAEIKTAKESAIISAPKVNTAAYDRAKAEYERAKRQHLYIQSQFNDAKAERDRLKSEFDALHAEHLRLKDEFKKKLEGVKSTKRKTEQVVVEKVNRALILSNAHYLGTIFGAKAKIVPREDGTGKTDVYFGGLLEAGDGLGHGHAVIDEEGNVTYLRDAWVADKKNDYLIDDRADLHGKETHKI